MSYTSRNPQFATVVLDDITTAATANPPASKHKLADRSGRVVVKNSAGDERKISPGTNYITYDSAATGWVASAAGSGGTALTVATVTTAGELPRNSTSRSGVKIVAPSGDTTNAYVYYDITLDDVDLNGRVMQIKWDQKPGAAAFVAGDVVVDIVAQSDRTTTISTPFTTAIPVVEGTFQTYFLSPSVAAIALRVKSIANAATDAAMVLSDVAVGPNVQVQGSAIGAWKSYIPSATGALGTPSAYDCWYRENGSNIDLMLKITTGTVAASAIYVNLPTGYTGDAKSTIRLLSGSVGSDYGGGTQSGMFPILDNSNPIAVKVGKNNTASVVTPVVGNAIMSNGSVLYISASVPVLELSSNVTLANRAAEIFASSTTGTWDAAAAAANTVFGPSGSPIAGTLAANRDKVVRLPQTPQSTDKIALEYRLTATGQWVDQSMTGYAFRLSPNIGFGGYISAMSGTDITVSFKQYAIAGTTYDSATGAINWNAAVVDAWRIRVTSGGASVGYPISLGNLYGDPTQLSDSLATQLGLKQYFCGTAYNGGVTPALSGGAYASTQRGVLIPYQTQSGVWRLKMSLQYTTTATVTGDVSLAGLVFANIASLSVVSEDFVQWYMGRTAATGGSLIVRTTGGSPTHWEVFSDVELSSKPTWAY